MTTGPSPVDRRLYGDLADDIHLLRTDGRIVARYKAGFRIDSSPEIFTAAQVRGMAAQLRARRQAVASRRPPDRPRARLVNHSISASAGSENPQASERARTTNEGGNGGPLTPIQEPRSPAFLASDSIPTVEPVVPTGNEGRAGERGTGPTADVRDKFARVVHSGNIAALWAEVDALKSAVERMRVQLAMDQGR